MKTGPNEKRQPIACQLDLAGQIAGDFLLRLLKIVDGFDYRVFRAR